MATLPGLTVNLKLESAAFIRGLQQVERSVSGTVTTVKRAAISLGSVLGLGLGARQIIEYADAWKLAGAQINLVSSSAGAAVQTQKQLFGIAQQLGVGFDGLSKIYTRTARSAGDLGISHQDLLDVSQALAAAVRVSGASAEEAQASLIQLSQSFASGALRGDELRSISEQLPVVLDAVGKAVGKTRSEVIAFAKANGLAASLVIEAVKRQRDEWIAQAESMPDTFGQATTRIQNSLEQLAGSANDAFRPIIDLMDQFAEALSAPAAIEGVRDLAQQIATFVHTTVQEFQNLIDAWESVKKSIGITGGGGDVLGQLATKALGFTGITPTPATPQVPYQRQKSFAEILSGTTASGQFGGAQPLLPLVGGASSSDKAAKAVEKHAEALKKAIEAAQAENSELEKLNGAYEGSVHIVGVVNDAIKVDNILRAAHISKLEAEHTGLLALLQANADYKNSIAALQQAQSVREEGTRLQVQIDARGRETEELRAQLAIIEARQQYGKEYTAQLESNIRSTEHLRSVLEQTKEAQKLDDTIEQQRLLLQFGSKETEEYRVQLELLRLKNQYGAAFAKQAEAAVRTAESQTTQIRAEQEANEQTKKLQEEAAKQSSIFSDAFKQAASRIQDTFADTFETIFSGGVTSFSDLADEVRRIFIRMAAEIAAALVFQPVLAGISGVGGIGAAAGGAGSLAGSLNAFGGRIGLAAPGGPGQPFVPGGVAGFQPATAGVFGSTATLSQLLGAGALGAAGGSLVGSFFGGQGTIGGAVGGGGGAALGALLGSAFPGVGTVAGGLAGGLLGSLGGGFLGSLFGGGNQSNQVSIRGPLGVAATGTGAAAQFVTQIDKQLRDLLTTAQEATVNRILKTADAVNVQYSKTPSANDLARLAGGRIGAAAQALGFRRAAIVTPGATAEEQLKNLQTAISIKDAIKKLVSGAGVGPAGQFADQITALRTQFNDTIASAKQFGISIAGTGKALKDALGEIRKQIASAISADALGIKQSFEALSGPLKDFQTQLKFGQLNPLQQFQAAQADFRRIAALARAGDINAINQFQAAAQLFIDQAEKVGSSPAQAKAIAEVQAANADVIKVIGDAQKAASAGVQGAIAAASRAQVDTLKELIGVARQTVAEIKKLQTQQARTA